MVAKYKSSRITRAFNLYNPMQILNQFKKNLTCSKIVVSVDPPHLDNPFTLCLGGKLIFPPLGLDSKKSRGKKSEKVEFCLFVR